MSEDKINNKVRFLEVSEHYVGQRIDNFLFREFKTAPRSLIYKLLRKGQVRVNKKRAKPEYKLVAGDMLRIPPFSLEAKAVSEFKNIDLSWLDDAIIFEDNKILVLNKPAGIPVHAGSKTALGVIEALRELKKDTEQYIELVHRLDKNTSGCLLFAKNSKTLKELQAQFKEGKVKKIYVCLVKGEVIGEHTVDVPLKKNIISDDDRMVTVDFENGKKAVSIFSGLKNSKLASLCEVEILTGRTHQIRAHAKNLNHPIACDDKYGDKIFNTKMKDKGLNRMFLHAKTLEFNLDKKYKFTAVLEKRLSKIIKEIF